jgi:hypothetical protein
MLADHSTKVTNGYWHVKALFFFFAGEDFEAAARPDMNLTFVRDLRREEPIFLCDNNYKFYKYRFSKMS